MPFGTQNKGKESSDNKPHPLAPEYDSWGGAAPCFGYMADAAMESEGKATGGWAVAAHLGVVCGGVALKMVLPAQKCYSRMQIFTVVFVKYFCYS